MTGITLIDSAALDQARLAVLSNVQGINDSLVSGWPVVVIFLTILTLFALVRMSMEAPFRVVSGLFR